MYLITEAEVERRKARAKRAAAALAKRRNRTRRAIEDRQLAKETGVPLEELTR